MSERRCETCRWFAAVKYSHHTQNECGRDGRYMQVSDSNGHHDYELPQVQPAGCCAFWERQTDGATRLELEALAKAAEAHAKAYVYMVKAGAIVNGVGAVCNGDVAEAYSDASAAWAAVAESMRPEVGNED